MSRRVYIALYALLAEVVAVAAAGNQWVTKYVNDHQATSPLGDQFLQSLPSFPWRVSTQSRPGANTILIAQYAAILTLFVLTFVIILVMLRGAASFSGPFFVSFCAVVTSVIVAQMVGSVVDFDYVGRSQHLGLGRVGYALFNSNDGLTIVFSLMCGLLCAIVAGIVGAIFRARAAREAEGEPPMFVPGLSTGPSPYGQPGDTTAELPPAGYGTVPAYAGSQPYPPPDSYPPPSYGSSPAYGTGYGADSSGGYGRSGDYGSASDSPSEQVSYPSRFGDFPPPETVAAESESASTPDPSAPPPPAAVSEPPPDGPSSGDSSQQTATTTVFRVPPLDTLPAPAAEGEPSGDAPSGAQLPPAEGREPQ